MNKKVHYLGMDVHKESIEIAIAVEGGEVRRYGQVGGTLSALDKAIGRLKQPGVELRFVYEAGPTGYVIYRHLQKLGYPCVEVAPSLTPRKSGQRIKTDRRDAETLARLFRAGELTPIHVPTEEDEAVRDRVRCRLAASSSVLGVVSTQYAFVSRLLHKSLDLFHAGDPLHLRPRPLK